MDFAGNTFVLNSAVVDAELAALDVRVDILESDVKDLDTRVDAVESDVLDLQANVTALEQDTNITRRYGKMWLNVNTDPYLRLQYLDAPKNGSIYTLFNEGIGEPGFGNNRRLFINSHSDIQPNGDSSIRKFFNAPVSIFSFVAKYEFNVTITGLGVADVAVLGLGFETSFSPLGPVSVTTIQGGKALSSVDNTLKMKGEYPITVNLTAYPDVASCFFVPIFQLASASLNQLSLYTTNNFVESNYFKVTVI